jgi:hypothetical protein
MSMSAVWRTAPAAMTACAPKTYQRTFSGRSALAMCPSSAATFGGGTLELLSEFDEAGEVAPRLPLEPRPGLVDERLRKSEGGGRPMRAHPGGHGLVLGRTGRGPVAVEKGF